MIRVGMKESKVLEQLFPSNHWQYRFEWIDLELSKLSLFLFDRVDTMWKPNECPIKSIKVAAVFWQILEKHFVSKGLIHRRWNCRCYPSQSCHEAMLQPFGPIVYNGNLKSQNQDQNSNLWYRISLFSQVFWPTGKTFSSLCVPCYYLVNGRRGASNPA